MLKKSLHIFILGAIVMLLCPGNMRAQYLMSGDDPSSLKWQQIKGDNYSVIFPEGTDSLARRYLYLFESTRDICQDGMSINAPTDVPIILHPYSIGGKSFPLWGPKRIEISTTPYYSSGHSANYELEKSLEINRLLCYLAHYNTYIFKFLEYIGGQQTIALGVGFRPTVWQAIGDAAIHSGNITGAGAADNGEFLMYYRAAFLNGDFRSYDDWRYGSYRYYTPEKTAFGYLMFSNYQFFSGHYRALGDVMHIQMKDWWDLFGVWNRSFLTVLNKTPRKNWRQMTAFNTHRWYADYLKRAPYTPYVHSVNKRKNVFSDIYTAHTNINPVGDNIYSTRSGLRYDNRLTRCDTTGKVKNIRPFSTSTSRIVNDGISALLWSEVIDDPRWDHRQYSIIREYDVNEGKIRNITYKSRLFNPVYTSDGKGILSVEYLPQGGSRVVLTNRENGENRILAYAPSNGQITEVCQKDRRIYALSICDDGMGLYSISDSTDCWRCEVAPQKRYMQHLSVAQDGLCFVYDLDGVCNIYLYDAGTKSLKRMVNSEYGAFYPNMKDGDLYYAHFDNKGFHPVKTAKEDFQMADASFDEPYRDPIAAYLARQAADSLTFLTHDEEAKLKARTDSLPVSPYRKGCHLFHIHSWAPFYANIDRISNFSYDHIYQLASLGATVISQNTMGTAVTQLGYSYHGGFHSGHLNFNYSGLYPVFELAVDFNDRHRQEVTIRERHYNSDGIITRYPLNFNIDTIKSPSIDASLKVYVPLEFNRSGWRNGLVPEVSLVTSNDKYTYVNSERTQSYFMTYDVTYGVRAFRMLERSKRQLSPRLGIGLQLKGRNAVGPHNASGNLAYVYAYGYLPGITPDQSIRLSACCQKQYGKNTTFRYIDNFASMPRGYSSRILSDYAKFTFDYGIFIYAGDVTWPWLFYLSRIQLIPFADFGIDFSDTYPDKSFNHPTPQNYPYSFGSDILLSGHFFRIGSEITFGLRYARTGEQKNSFNLILKSSL